MEEYPTSHAVFLQGIPKNIEREQIYEFCQQHGWVKKFDLPPGDRKKKNKGFAYVHFKTKSEAQRLLEIKSLDFHGKQIRISKYTDRRSTGHTTPVNDSGMISTISGTPKNITSPTWNRQPTVEEINEAVIRRFSVSETRPVKTEPDELEPPKLEVAITEESSINLGESAFSPKLENQIFLNSSDIDSIAAIWQVGYGVLRDEIAFWNAKYGLAFSLEDGKLVSDFFQLFFNLVKNLDPNVGQFC